MRYFNDLPSDFFSKIYASVRSATNFSKSNDALRGFTLIELMIVLLIVSVLMLIAVPSYQSQQVKANRESARSQLMMIMAELTEYRVAAPEQFYAIKHNINDLISTQADTDDFEYQLTPNPIGKQAQYWVYVTPKSEKFADVGAISLSNIGEGCYFPDGAVNQSFSCSAEQSW